MRRAKRIAPYLVMFACACLTMAVIIGFRPLQAQYHRWRLKATLEAIYSKPTGTIPGTRIVAYGSGELIDAFDHHLARLVELGAITRIDYRFEHVVENSPLRYPFMRELLQNCPPNVHWVFPSVEDDANTRISVWCEHKDADAWRRLLAAKDDEFEDLSRGQEVKANQTTGAAR